jgi:hypothetical protein
MDFGLETARSDASRMSRMSRMDRTIGMLERDEMFH